MSISESDVRHIASLSRLRIDDARVGPLVEELNGILLHMDVLQRVELTGGEAGAASDALVADAPAMLRTDEPRSEPLAVSRAAFAPAERDGFFLVPRLSTHE